MSDNSKYYSREDIGDSDFWDLSKSKGISRPAPSYPIHKKPTPKGALIEHSTKDSAPEPSFKIPEKKTGFSSPDTIIEYTPANIFINKVKITTTDKEKSIFNPSALFMRERAALLDRKGSPCSYVSFYAHSPRYSSMTRAQLSYYLWWRENVRRGELIKTDISYIKLYVQEIVTAQDGENVNNCLCDLINIAKACFDNPVGKIYMARIISDFCLMHRLECPTEEIADIIPQFVFEHIADEFFLGLSDANRHIYTPIAINHISIYNYKKSKFYDEFNKAVFDKHIPAALHTCFVNDAAYRAIAANASGIFSTKLSDRKLFDGRVEFCAPSARIIVSYFPISCISGIITDTVRYCENKLRTALGIRTLLATGEISREITDVIDDYFASVSNEFSDFKTREKQKTEKKAEEEYSHLYDIPKAQLSLTNAKEIEARSWQTTKKLTEAFDNDIKPVEDGSSAECEVQSAECEAPVGDGGLNVPSESIWGEHRKFLLICRDGSVQEQKAYAKSHGMTLDGLADVINEIAVENTGDIILEDSGEGYTVIEDYFNLI